MHKIVEVPAPLELLCPPVDVYEHMGLSSLFGSCRVTKEMTQTRNPNSTEVADLAVETTPPQSARADDASSKHEPPLRAGRAMWARARLLVLGVEKCPEERRSSPKPLKDHRSPGRCS